MRRLVFFINVSADGMYSGEDGGLGDFEPAEDEHRYAEDLIGTRDEPSPGERWERVMELVMAHGEAQPMPSLDEIRERHQLEVSRLPPALLRLRGSGGYRVRLSPALQARQEAAAAAVRARETLRTKTQP